MKDPPPIPQCHMCGKEDVDYFCEKCDKHFCDTCCNTFHSHESRRDHIKTPVEKRVAVECAPPPPSEPVDNCYMCGNFPVWQCTECSKTFCELCDQMFHNHDGRKHHERDSICVGQDTFHSLNQPSNAGSQTSNRGSQQSLQIQHQRSSPSREEKIYNNDPAPKLIQRETSSRALVVKYSPHLTYEQADTAAKLIQQGHNEPDVIEAVKNTKTLNSALDYIKKTECPGCKGNHCVGQMIEIPMCHHHVCKLCCQQHFVKKIINKIGPLRCLKCKNVFITAKSDDAVNLDTFMKPLMGKGEYDTFQKKYDEHIMVNNPNYKTCSKCRQGFLKFIDYRTYSCSRCNTVFCGECDNHWTMEHDNKTCEEYTNNMPQNMQNFGSIGRLSRSFLAKGKSPSLPKAEIAVMLIQMNYEEDEALSESRTSNSIHTAINNLKKTYQECSICMENYPVQGMESMMYCPHSFCKQCTIHYFTTTIRDRSIVSLGCPACSIPNLQELDTRDAQTYFSLMDTYLRNLLPDEDYQLYMRKVTTMGLSTLPNFVYCPNPQCQGGYIGDPALTKYMCEYCATTICSKCKLLWEQQHTGLTCEQFKAWKNDNDPEFSKQYMNHLFAEKGIQCPKCKFQFEFARGGCIHYTCTQCKFEFCNCGEQFHHGVHDNCQQGGLHCHHPRNCFYYLRDEEPALLQQLLTTNNTAFNTDPPAGVNVAANCPLLLQKNLGDEETPCNEPINAGEAGFCRNHYLEYLGNLILQHKVDPIPILNIGQLARIIEREGNVVPVKTANATDAQYSQVLQEFIKTNIPLK